ncbi:prepilin-type N-terminal cleavage/methylation domain-containing protein [Candidatus Kaiserbacteria bacterium]|nr:prepilin-type N-terminal cleavage/methylation domain-containing protein [Candidatus Kaiserbacteria bacterium]
MKYFSGRGINVKPHSGFTLIELLVVIAIIGLLASVVMANLNSARAKARDARRRADMKELYKALELYYDTNGAYPSTGNAWIGNCASYGSYGTSGASGYIPNLAPTYIPTLPLDPKYNGSSGCYLYNSNGVEYKLLAHYTVESICPVPSSDAFWDPVRNGQCTFQISTSGARSTY